MKTETIPFRDFMDGSWKKSNAVKYLPGIVFIPNEPTTFLITMLGIGLVVLVVEQLTKETDYAEQVRIFRTRYIKYAYPICVVATGAYIFMKIVKILL